MNLYSTEKIPINTLANIIGTIILKISNKKNFSALTIIMPYVSPVELIIYCMVVNLTSSVMDKKHHTNT